MKYLLIGIFISILGVIASLLLEILEHAHLVTGALGLLFLGISILISGIIMGPHRYKADLHVEEPPEQRKKRRRTAAASILIGLPNIAVALLLYMAR
ncbi:DUF5316 domain-containing protein [Bacillus infantis]|uniref:DUF5316 family protein n=1 Tax=Bacillus infantis TaxID=324767 RepID=UPI000B9ACE82|nr:DUF5316 family protein [Bacillus infantis]MCK6205542.1 DUF5316 domain-containing protein [Bacillus infantis]OXT18119.1 hypothetical protein B9K06_06305 [Bacillus sp. OG2]